MALASGAMGNLAPKLLQLLQDEYKLQKGVKQQVESLARDFRSMHVSLCKVAKVPFDELDPQVKLWANDAREASYNIEDILDSYLVRIQGCQDPTGDADKSKVNRLIKRMCKKFNISRFKTRHEIAGAIEEIKKQVDEMAKRHDRHRVDQDLAKCSTSTDIDSRILKLLDTKACELIDIDEPTDALKMMLTSSDDNASDKKLNIVSVVGPGGLGKTTVAKAVYEKLTGELNIYCKAFVPVGRNPDLKKVLRDILHDLDRSQYIGRVNYLLTLDEEQLIKQIQAFLKEKRYFIVIDDVWDVQSWKYIRIAFEDNNLGSKVVITSRCYYVADLVDCTYKMKPLSLESSKILFHRRIFGCPDRCPEILSEVSYRILKKCDGVPLVIITIASLLANKSGNIAVWEEVCNSLGSGLSESSDMDKDMKKILLLSYYDLPSHVRNCFLYLSLYPEDYKISRDDLIWSWISEGFILPQRKGDDLFELGESYFNDLINRSLVQPAGEGYDMNAYFRVHDIILDLICSLSREENFITTSYDIEQVVSSESKKHRRLSLRSTKFWPKKGVKQVRSVFVFGSRMDTMPSFSCFVMLRVLNLECCTLKYGRHKLSLGNLIHLRYLSLGDVNFSLVDLEGIENLQFLQVLKTATEELPESIFRLRGLMCLEGTNCCPSSGNLLRNLASLQVLNRLTVRKDPAGIMEALGYLTRLTNLTIQIRPRDQSICDTFIDSLGNLQRLQTLMVYGSSKHIRWERWAPPQQLRGVEGISLRVLPKWINPSSHPHLANIDMWVHDIGPRDIQKLGTLPNLVHLYLSADHDSFLEQHFQKFMLSTDAFPRLRRCWLKCVSILPSMLPCGAMSQVEVFCLNLRTRDFFSPALPRDFDDLTLNHLPSLQEVTCEIYKGTTDATQVEEVEKLKQVVKHAMQEHPNNPKLSVYLH